MTGRARSQYVTGLVSYPGLNRNGIDTGGTPAQNDRFIGALSLPSELLPRITVQNRNGIDTGGTPAQNDRFIVARRLRTSQKVFCYLRRNETEQNPMV